METKGTIKLFDGVYVGDQQSSRDQELLLLNHISAVINFTKLPNYYHHYDIHYSNMQWPCKNISQITTLISQVRQQGQSILLHGQNNLDRPVAAVTIYLMDRFRWSLFKTLQFINSRVDALAFTDQSFQILKKYQLSLLGQEAKLSYNWERKCNDTEQLVLRNTFINSNLQKQKTIISTPSKPKPKRSNHISWKLPKKNIPVQYSQQKGFSLNLRDKVLSNVRKIMKKQQNQDIDKGKLSKNESKQHNPSLKKYKSTYNLGNLPLFQHQETKKSQRNQPLTANTFIIKRSATEQSQHFIISKNEKLEPNQNKTNPIVTRKTPSHSLKKIRMKQQIKQVSTKQFFQRIR